MQRGKAGFSGVFGNSAGQASIEFLMLTIILLAFISILGGLAFITFSDSSATNLVQDSLRVLRTAVNHANALGPGNAVVVSINLPGPVKNSAVGGVSGKELIFTLSTGTGDRNYWVSTDTNVVGSLPKSAGLFSVRIVADVNSVSVMDLNG